jgi:hypothetical protein
MQAAPCKQQCCSRASALLQVGLHHSRLASSLISLLNIVMDGNRRAQDLVRESGGVALLCRALDLLVQPGVSDILQLRVALCLALQRAVQVRLGSCAV